jgi:outer membrane protein
LLAQAQIGYVNLDAALQLMPEMQTMQQELRIYEQRQSRQWQPLSDSIEAGRQALREMQQAGMPRERMQTVADSLETIRQRLIQKQETAKAGLELRQELFLSEIYAKIEYHLDQLAEEEGYEYIFNAQAQGNSVFLHSPEGVNLTRDLLKRMQVPLDELQASDQP